MKALPAVSLVVIGRNEERNLAAAFEAIRAMDYPREMLEVIYVDSDSLDGSIGIAEKYADAVIVEKHPLPSAARGRNEGLRRARHGIVHFVDGDTAIDPGYLKGAAAVLADPDVHAVGGYLKEGGVGFWARLMASAWDGPRDGPATSTSGGGTYRRDPLLSVNGYDERLVMGEETELGERFRGRGYKIRSIDLPMGIHRNSVGGLAGYLRWCVKNGRNRARCLFVPGDSDFFRQNRRLARNNALAHLLIVLAAGLALLARRPLYLPGLICAYLLFLLVKYLAVRRVRNGRLLLHLVFMNLARPFSFWGQCAEYLKLARDRRYRGLVSAGKAVL
jgi:glycosyltransferase involved in cell wall biosynthesis